MEFPDAVAGNTGAAHLDLNQSWNWSGLYAYKAVGTANGAIANFDYHNTLSSARVDPYAAEVFKTSNAYGWSFSDFIASLGGVTNPTLNLWNGTADADISIKLFGLTIRPTGYTPTALSSLYLAPSGTVAATMATSTGASISSSSIRMVGIPGSTHERGAGRRHADDLPLLFSQRSRPQGRGFVRSRCRRLRPELQVTNNGGWAFTQGGSLGPDRQDPPGECPGHE